jgi:hypothetical protein
MSSAMPPSPLQNSHRGLSSVVFFLFLRDGCISSFVAFCVLASLAYFLFFSLQKKMAFRAGKKTQEEEEEIAKTKAR